jgi:hypothetical protein
MASADSRHPSWFPLEGDNLYQAEDRWWSCHYEDEAKYSDAFLAGGRYVIQEVRKLAQDRNDKELIELLNKLSTKS